MTVRELIKGLTSLCEEHPEALDYEAIYASDNEGNSYHVVHNNGTLVEVEDVNARYVELVWNENEETNSANPNAVIIN